jgi:hypothetical protein
MTIRRAGYFPAEVWDGHSIKSGGYQLHGSSPSPADWDQICEEVNNIQSVLLADGWDEGTAGDNVNAVHRGTIGRFTTLTLGGTIDMVDAGAAGTHGSRLLFTFPTNGPVKIGIAKANVHIVSDAAGLDADAALVAALGTVAVGTGNATLSGTEADIIISTAVPLTSSEGDFTAVWNLGPLNVDHTHCYLNLAAPDADSDADDVITVSGIVTIQWLSSI